MMYIIFYFIIVFNDSSLHIFFYNLYWQILVLYFYSYIYFVWRDKREQRATACMASVRHSNGVCSGYYCTSECADHGEPGRGAAQRVMRWVVWSRARTAHDERARIRKTRRTASQVRSDRVRPQKIIYPFFLAKNYLPLLKPTVQADWFSPVRSVSPVCSFSPEPLILRWWLTALLARVAAGRGDGLTSKPRVDVELRRYGPVWVSS